MADPVRPNTFADGQVIDALRMNQDFDAIYDWATTQAVHRDGSKAFTALPSGPGSGTVPSSDAQLANKLYVDQQIATVTGTSPDGTIWTSANDGAGSGMDADLLDGVQSYQFARKDQATETFSGRIGVASGGSSTPGVYFTAGTNTGIFFNNGLSLTAGGQEAIGINQSSGGINLNKTVKAYGLVSSSAGGTPLYHSGSNYDIYRYTSTIESKDNVREEGAASEYVAKLLATDLPTWDALVLHEDGSKSPAGDREDVSDRGTTYDRVGPIVERMHETFPEGVIYKDGKATTIDEALILTTVWAGFKQLVDDLKAAEVLPEAWPLAA